MKGEQGGAGASERIEEEHLYFVVCTLCFIPRGERRSRPVERGSESDERRGTAPAEKVYRIMFAVAV